jgi:LDH2 family malate/lactate/ureidoglycolate dehydrogenase
VGAFFQAVDINAFQPAAEFKAEMDDVIRTFKAAEPAPGFEGVLMPGEIEFRKREQTLREGVSLGPVTLGELDALGMRLGVGTIPRG